MTDVTDAFEGDVPETIDEAALRRLRFVSSLLDEAVRIPGTNVTVGLDPIMGVVPGAGDALTTAVSLYIVAEAAYLGVPMSTVVRMLAAVGVDAAVGSVPVVGTLVDVFWKANKWNVDLIEEWAESQADADADEGVRIDVSD